jgi:hypothetical protein
VRSLRDWFTRRAMVVALVVLFLATVTVALIAAVEDRDNWTLSDWANLLISLALSLYFLLLAQYLNRNAQNRAEAVADADLLTSLGRLAMNSARSLDSAAGPALRVAADSMAAIEHYDAAPEATRRQLARAVEDAYIDLAFSTIARADSLARSVWMRLCEGTASLIKALDHLAYDPTGRELNRDLVDACSHICFVEALGRAIHDYSGAPLDRVDSVPLDVWDPSRLPESVGRSHRITQLGTTTYRLDRFKTLYRHELTVKHNWDILHDSPDLLTCAVELVDVAKTADWLAPWYVHPEEDKPVNVLRGDLNERAKHDELHVTAETPRWPKALQHGRLPGGMRTAGIESLCRLLESQGSPTICVLAYDIVVETGVTMRVVLDGNHRLAAARKVSLGPASEPAQNARRFRVLAFVLRETEAVLHASANGGPSPLDRWTNDMDFKHPDGEPVGPYRGFTPDLSLLRGSWLPEQQPRPDDVVYLRNVPRL